MRLLPIAAVLTAAAFAPACMAQGLNGFDNGPPESYQSYAHTLTHYPERGGYDEELGTSQRGIPAAAQDEAERSVARDRYDQWDYTGWTGLTRNSHRPIGPNSAWSARDGHYVQAIPPGR
jgi:hypothetical protein